LHAEIVNVDLIYTDELEEVLKIFKYKTTTGQNDENAELPKYTPIEIKIGLFNIINICWIKYKILEKLATGIRTDKAVIL
jgi:hypothetical protein